MRVSAAKARGHGLWVRPLLIAAALAACGWTSANGQAAAPSADEKRVIARGEALFSQHCSGCHEPPIEGAPSQADLASYDPQTVVEILRQGPMVAMAKDLTDADIEAINKYLHAN